MVKIPWGAILHWGEVSTWKFRLDYCYKLCAGNRRRTFNFTPSNLNKEKEIIGIYRNAPVLFIRQTMVRIRKSITLSSMVFWVLESEYSFGKNIRIVSARCSKLKIFVNSCFAQRLKIYESCLALFLQYEGLGKDMVVVGVGVTHLYVKGMFHLNGCVFHNTRKFLKESPILQNFF